MSTTSFHRGLTVCDICLSSDGWEHVPYVSVDKVHPLYGCLFAQLQCGRVLDHIIHITGLQSHSDRWWFAIDGHGCADEDAALVVLREVSDELSMME